MPALALQNHIGVIAGGFGYEQDSVEKSTQHVMNALSALEYVAETFRAPFDRERFLAFQPATSVVIDPYFIDTKRIGEIEDIRLWLDHIAARYTGSRPAAAAICRDKAISKDYFAALGIRTPEHCRIDGTTSADGIEHARDRFGFPVIIKPVSEGSGIGVQLCTDSDHLSPMLDRAIQKFKGVLVEQYIEGTDATVTVIGSSERAKPLTPVEIELKTSPIYDYATKRGDKEVQHVPARLEESILEELQRSAVAIHRAIGCRGLSRVDFRVSGQTIWCLEINASPALGKHGNLPRAWNYANGTYSSLIETLLFDSLD